MSQWLRSASIVVLAFCCATAAGSAAAQNIGSYTPQIDTAVDENGVDLINRGLLSNGASLSIGVDGMSRSISDDRRRDEWHMTLNAVGSLFTISVGGSSEAFTQTTGGFVPVNGGSGKFEVGASPNTYVYTTGTGDVIVFDTTLASTYFITANRGFVTSLTTADGEHFSFSYKTATIPNELNPRAPGIKVTRLRSVVSSRGFQIHYEYQSDKIDDGYSLLTQKITLLNRAGEYCNPSADHCSGLSSAWPTFNQSGWNVTTPDGQVHAVTSGAYTQYGAVNNRTFQHPNGTQVSYTYNAGTNSAVFNNSVGTWNYVWATSGSTVTATITDPLNRTRTVTYDSTQKKILTDTNALNHTTSYQYDSFGRRTRITQPEGNYTQYTYDGRGNVTNERVVAKSGSGLADLVTVYDYDVTCTNFKKCNKPNSVTDVAGKVTDYTYNANGMVTSVKSPAPYSGAPRPENALRLCADRDLCQG